ncbi:MAG: hypothetical protein NTZ17_08730 [Phycisphaerae bacterium]|nr:hypothetical protein [Phycisphaerae bacterium]
MTSAAQVQANRSNAQKSTGPRAAEGKAVVAQNAVKHGLLAQEVVVKGEDPGEFEFYRDQMLAELAPAGQMESMLAQRIVGLAWRLRRAERLQAVAFDKLEDQSKPPEWVLSPEQASRLLAVMAETGVRPPEPVAAGPAAGRRAVQDFAQERILDRLLVYERRIEHSLYRTMGEFRKQRLLREMEPTAGMKPEAGMTRRTGILPVSSMGVPPMTAEDIHGQDARATHGRDAHATRPPEGGTPNESCQTNPIGAGSNVGDSPNEGEAQEESRQTNPICGGVSSLTCEVVREQSPVAGSPGPATPKGTLAPGDGSTCGVGTNMPQVADLSCETKPMSAAARKDPIPYVPIFRRRR